MVGGVDISLIDEVVGPPKIKMVGFYGKRPGVPSIHFDEKPEQKLPCGIIANLGQYILQRKMMYVEIK